MSEYKKGDKVVVKEVRNGPGINFDVPGEIVEVQLYVKVEWEGRELIKMLKPDDLVQM